jgi:hypothetical protein
MVNPAFIKADPAEQNYNSAPYAVPENIATVDSIKNNILDQNKSLNAVNNLTKGGSRGRKRARKSSSSSSSRGNRSHRRRNYKSRRTYKRKSQKGGQVAGAIPIFQSPGHATCTEGSQCPGAHNAVFTSISNQLESNGKNDTLVGGKKRFKNYNKKHSSKRKH